MPLKFSVCMESNFASFVYTVVFDIKTACKFSLSLANHGGGCRLANFLQENLLVFWKSQNAVGEIIYYSAAGYAWSSRFTMAVNTATFGKFHGIF